MLALRDRKEAQPAAIANTGEEAEYLADPAHPRNLPTWRKVMLLVTVSMAAWLANYSAGAHLTAFPQLAEYFGVSIAAVANAIGIAILGLGVGPLILGPLSSSIGRRSTLLLAWTLFIPCGFWMAFSKSYSAFAAGRFFAGFFSSVAQTVPAAQIADIFSPRVRGTAVAVWSLAIVAGPVCAPLVGAALVTAADLKWQWIYYLVIMMSGVVWVMIIVFVPETLYIPPAAATASTGTYAAGTCAGSDSDKDSNGEKDADFARTFTPSPNVAQETAITGGRRGAAWMPWHNPGLFLSLMVEPIKMIAYLPILLPSLYYAMLFGWSVGFTVITPQVFEKPPFNFTNVAIGASFMASFAGAIIGKASGGYFADWTVTFWQKRRGGVREPEYRLWALLPQLPFIFVGVLMYGIGIQEELSWAVPIIVGIGGLYVGLNATTSIIQTYIVETYLPKAAHAIASFNLIKCAFAFAVPFFVPDWAIGDFTNAYAIQASLGLGLGLALCFGLIALGKKIRRWQGMPEGLVEK